MLEKTVRWFLIIAAASVVLVVGRSWLYVTAEVTGWDGCPRMDAAPAGVAFADRRRTEQRLNPSYDIRPEKGDTSLSCTSIFGQSRCEVTGPALIETQIGFAGTPEYYAIPEGRTAYLWADATDLLCTLLDEPS